MDMKASAKHALGQIGLLSPAQVIVRGYYQTMRPIRETLRRRYSIGLPPLVDAPRYRDCVSSAIRELAAGGHKLGDYYEFGVSRGTSLAAAFKATEDADAETMNLYGFDSFEGLPAEADGQGWSAGEFRSSLWNTRRYLKRHGVAFERTHLIKGWFKDTATEAVAERFNMKHPSVVMIDCDIYSAAKEALWFIGPRVTDQCVILFDDWGWTEEAGKRGEKEAFEEFCAEFGPFDVTPLAAYFDMARVFLLKRA